MKRIANENVRNAVSIGLICSLSYLAVYFARNILSAVAPQMQSGGYTTEIIGRLSSVYFVAYAVGQLINGMLGDRIKARYMMNIGLLLAGVGCLVFPWLPSSFSMIAYALTGFFLSMIYGPMVKVVAENVEPVYATRCSLGFTFASFFGSPLAGLAATFLAWQSVFFVGAATLAAFAVICFFVLLHFEKKGIVKYRQYRCEKRSGGGVGVLLRYHIVKFSAISILTGIVRTTVVFWLPTYISSYLGFSAKASSAIFTGATLAISLSAFLAVFVYERLKRDMDKTVLLMFSLSAVFFLAVYWVRNPVINIVCIVLAVMASGCVSTMLWSRYCPSLRDTGMVSGATGFLDFLSYMAAAVSSTVFANMVSVIGWGNLILLWMGLMVIGIVLSLPYEKLRRTVPRKP